MDPLNWPAIVRDVLLFIVIPGVVFFWGRDRKQTAEAILAAIRSEAATTAAGFVLRDERHDGVVQRLDDHDKRFDRAGEKISELASTIQGLIAIQLKIAQLDDLKQQVVMLERLCQAQSTQLAILQERLERRFFRTDSSKGGRTNG